MQIPLASPWRRSTSEIWREPVWSKKSPKPPKSHFVEWFLSSCGIKKNFWVFFSYSPKKQSKRPNSLSLLMWFSAGIWAGSSWLSAFLSPLRINKLEDYLQLKIPKSRSILVHFLFVCVALSLKNFEMIDYDTISSPLEYDFYRVSCPKAQQIVRQVVENLYQLRPDMAPSLLCLTFHDWFHEASKSKRVMIDSSPSCALHQGE